jgi:hypothetical protein
MILALKVDATKAIVQFLDLEVENELEPQISFIRQMKWNNLPSRVVAFDLVQI